MSQFKPDIFDRDRPLTWNLFGFFATRSKYGVGNEWEHFEEDDGTLVCEECGYPSGERPVMIVNDPFDPETPVDFDSPTQVLCDSCTRETLSMDSDYRFDSVKDGSTADLHVDDLDSLDGQSSNAA
jgi:hypothetical protein